MSVRICAFIIQSESHVNINLRGVNEVHLQQTGLQMSLCRSVVLESVQQERGALLNQVAFHEHVDDLRSSKRTHIKCRNRGNV